MQGFGSYERVGCRVRGFLMPGCWLILPVQTTSKYGPPLSIYYPYLRSQSLWYNPAANRPPSGGRYWLGHLFIPRPALDEYFRQYGLIAIFAVIAFIVPASMMMASWATSRLGIRPSNPTPVKLETYECGMEALGGRWTQFNFRYYMYAILFVIFDVEVVFLYPWAAKFLQLELFALIEMGVFVLILLIGWAYAWRKRDLEWG